MLYATLPKMPIDVVGSILSVFEWIVLCTKEKRKLFNKTLIYIITNREILKEYTGMLQSSIYK